MGEKGNELDPSWNKMKIAAAVLVEMGDPARKPPRLLARRGWVRRGGKAAVLFCFALDSRMYRKDSLHASGVSYCKKQKK